MAGKSRISRRSILKGLGPAGALIRVGLPPLEAMFNSHGTAYAASGKLPASPIESRFLLWFNGNGIPERYWIPAETGTGYELTPCLTPLAPFREGVHIITGLDNPAARMPGPGNDHHRSMSGLVSGTPFTGRGAGGASIDQLIANKIGGKSRFRSLQIGVCQESFGEAIQRNLSWADRDRPGRVLQIGGLHDHAAGHRLEDIVAADEDRRREVGHVHAGPRYETAADFQHRVENLPGIARDVS